jgi:sugar phosphate permease
MAKEPIKSGRIPLHYGWVVAGVTFLALLVAAGIRSAPSVMIVPLETEFGWSRATISFAIAVQLMFFGLVGPFSAGFIDRLGLRRTMVAALLMLVSGFGLTPLVTHSWMLLPLWGVLVGTGTGTAAMVMAAIVANRWFIARRGLVMGLLSGSSAAGNLIFLPLLANVVVDFGWRVSVLAGCAIVVLILPLVALLVRDQPADIGLAPFGQPPGSPAAPPLSRANPFGAAFAALGRGAVSRDFWLLSATFFVCGASTLGLIGTHFIPACLDHGIAEVTAASILGAMGICNFIGTTTAGWLSDRFDNRYLLFWIYGLRGLSLLFLPAAFEMSPWTLSIFGLFYGLDWIATVPPTVKLCANTFGPQQAGVMYGWLMVMHQVGSATAAYGAGLLRVTNGSYTDAFLASGGLCLLAALLALRIGSKNRSSSLPALVTAEA